MYLSRLGYFALFGGTIGALLDQAHTYSGAIIKPDGEDPIWSDVLTFGIVYPVIAFLYTFYVSKINVNSKCPAPIWCSQMLTIMTFIPGYLWTCNRYFTSSTIAISLGVVTFLVWVANDRTRVGLIGALLTAVLGTSFEIALASCPHRFCDAPVFDYAEKDIAGRVPYWLPLIYCLAAVTLGQAARRLLLIDNYKLYNSRIGA